MSLARWKREEMGRVVRSRTQAGSGVLGRTLPTGRCWQGGNKSSVLKGKQGGEHSITDIHWRSVIVWILLKEHLKHNIAIQLYFN